MDGKELESMIEGILFAAGDPVGVERICMALGEERAVVDAACRSLADRYRYERRGIRLVQMDSCWQMCSSPEHAEVIRKTLETRKPAKLSQAALEVLAIVAYFQPVTRAYVDQVRGVDSSYTMNLLQDRELIEECGRLAVPGRPIQFRTTGAFLRTFGLTNLTELPELPGLFTEDGQSEGQSALERMLRERGTETAEASVEEMP